MQVRGGDVYSETKVMQVRRDEGQGRDVYSETRVMQVRAGMSSEMIVKEVWGGYTQYSETDVMQVWGECVVG